MGQRFSKHNHRTGRCFGNNDTGIVILCPVNLCWQPEISLMAAGNTTKSTVIRPCICQIPQGESFLGRKWLIGKKIKKELDKPEGISHAKMV